MIHSAFLRVSVLAGSLILAVACGKDKGNLPHPDAIRLTPNTGSTGDLVTIEGMNFSSINGNEVKFNGQVTPVISATPDKLVVVVPQDVTTGKVQVNTPSASMYRTSTTDFKADASRPPAGCGSRMAAAAFTIGTKAYVVGGRHTDSVIKRDTWEFDSQTQSWTRKADYPFGDVEGAFAFSINGKGYVGGGTGYSPNNTFYEFDPVADAWTRKADLSVTTNPVTFVINGKGYVATGGENLFSRGGNKLMEYDPATNVWTARAPFSGSARTRAAGFVLNNKAYLGTGSDRESVQDFYAYDPATNAWTKKADFPGGARSGAVGFVRDGKGYMGTGYGQLGTSSRLAFQNDVWSYNPDTDQWQPEAPLQAAPRSSACAFTFANSVFILGGRNDYYSMDDLRQYP